MSKKNLLSWFAAALLLIGLIIIFYGAQFHRNVPENTATLSDTATSAAGDKAVNLPTLSDDEAIRNAVNNGTFPTGPMGVKISFKDGHGIYQQINEGKAGAAVTLTTTQDLNHVTLSDLNGDGTQEAVAILGENDGGSGYFESVVPFINDGQSLYLGGGYSIGDRTVVQSISIEQGIITVHMLTSNSGEGLCCPSTPETLRLSLKAGKLIQAAP